MAENLTKEKIEEIAKNYEKIVEGKVPVIKSQKETVTEKIDPKIVQNQKKYLKMIPPSDPRLLMQIAPFLDENLEKLGFKDRVELSKVMYDTMAKYGGIGLSANQVGLPFRMFIMGGHPQIDNGRVRSVFNPLINDVSEETVSMKEGCLSFPFLFLTITRPKWCHVKYTDENGKDVEEVLHGMNARIFMHENEHMNGYVFTDLVSKFKLKRAEEARKKMVKRFAREGVIRK
jgi:peptide deformylase